MKKLTIYLSFLFLLFSTISCNAQNSVEKDNSKNVGNNNKMTKTSESKYKVGQMWSYKTRPNEEDSYFIVLKIDMDEKLGNIIHIAVLKLKMKNPNSPDGTSDMVAHMPFSEKSINESAVKLIKEDVQLPDFEEGYQIWKEAFDAQKAGIYTITVMEAVKIMEATINQ